MGLAKEAERVRVASLGTTHVETARASWLVGKIAIVQQRPDIALAALSNAEAVVSGSAQATAEEKLRLLSDLLELLRWFGRCGERAAASAKALIIQERAYGEGAGSIRWLVAAADAHECLCQSPQALAAAHRAVGLATRSGQPELLGVTSASVAAIHIHQGEHALAIPWLQRSIAGYEAANVRNAALVHALQDLANCLLMAKKPEAARAVAERAESVAQTACGDAACKREATWARALILARTGDPVAAKAALDRASLTFYEWNAERGGLAIAVDPFDAVHSFTKIPEPPPQCGRLSESGSLLNAAAVVAALGPAFRACYNDALRVDGTLETTVRISGTVGPDGAVTMAGTLHETRLQPLIICLIHAVSVATFSPPTAGKATIVIPVTLVRRHAIAR